MSEPIRIVVPFDPSRLSANQRLHWRERAKRTQAVRVAARYCWALAGEPRAAGKVRVSMVVRRGRKLDEDNAISGSKAVRDALFNGAVTPRDSQDWVTLGSIEFQCGKRWERCPEVEFVIEPVLQDLGG